MTDFLPTKIAIYEGINDTPIAPSSTKGGNISHFYEKYNQLVDLIIELKQELLSQIPAEVETRLDTLESNATVLDDYVSNELTDKVNYQEGILNSYLDITNQTHQDFVTQVNTTLDAYQQSVTDLISTIPNYDDEISTLQVFLDDLTARVTALENVDEPPPIEWLPMPEGYVFTNLEITPDGLHYQFAEAGTIDTILVSGSSDIYDLYFELNESILTGTGWTTTPEGIVLSFAETLTFAVDDTFKIYVGGSTQSEVAIEFNLVAP